MLWVFWSQSVVGEYLGCDQTLHTHKYGVKRIPDVCWRLPSVKEVNVCPRRPCKKPLSPSCTVQMSDTSESPMPIPLLAAALGADTRSVLLAYGSHLQPVMETAVSTLKHRAGRCKALWYLTHFFLTAVTFRVNGVRSCFTRFFSARYSFQFRSSDGSFSWEIDRWSAE